MEYCQKEDDLDIFSQKWHIVYNKKVAIQILQPKTCLSFYSFRLEDPSCESTFHVLQYVPEGSYTADNNSFTVCGYNS